MYRIVSFFIYTITIINIISCVSEEKEQTPVFQDKDFELCNVPLPEGYPMSWTHPGIAWKEKPFHGYHYFLTCSPYPNGDDDWENPMFYYANDRADGVPPVDFTPYKGNPTQNDPGDGYNADPDVVFIDTALYVTNRAFLRPNLWYVNAQKCNMRDSSNISFTAPVPLYDNKQTPRNFGFELADHNTLISPSFVSYEGIIRSYHLASNSYNDGSQCRGVVIMEGTSFDEEYTFHYLKTTQFENMPEGIRPWHFDVFAAKDKLYAIVCCVTEWNSPSDKKCAQYLAVSDDWENFRFYKTPLTTINSYRSTAFVRNDGMFVMYVSTLKFYPKGNKSVDGRNIIMAYKYLPEVLKKLEEAEK